MLYQIKDKNGLITGVHECPKEELKDYLTILPKQTAPYTAVRILPHKVSLLTHFHELLNQHLLLVGVITSAPVYFVLFELLKHFNLI